MMKVQYRAQGLKPLISHPVNANCSSNGTNDDETFLNLPVWDGESWFLIAAMAGRNCRHFLNVATINVRTIRLESKRIELASNCSDHTIAILGVIDHKIVHDDPVLVQNYGTHALITTSAWRKSNNAAAEGVGLRREEGVRQFFWVKK